MNNIQTEAFKVLEKILSYDQAWVFRGHKNSEWKLVSTLERIFKNDEDFCTQSSTAEETVIDLLKARAHHYTINDSLPTSEFGWLSLAQHFGAPTRLIDFTENPLTALYFSTRDFLHSRDNLCLWCLNYREINMRFSEEIEEISRDSSITIDRDPDGFFQLVADISKTHEISGAWIGEPRHRNVRIERQAGTFLIPSRPNIRINDILASTVFERTYHKIEIRSELRIELVRLLTRSGTTASSMFNDLPGLASDIHDLLTLFINFKPNQ